MSHQASHVPVSRRRTRLRVSRQRAREGGEGDTHAAAVSHVAPEPTVIATPASRWKSGLRQRSLAALVLMPLIIALVWFGGWIAFAGALVALLVGMLELREMFAHKGWHPVLPLSFALGVDFLVAAMLPGPRLALVALGISGFVMVSFVWLMLTRPTIEHTMVDWALTLAAPFYLGWPLAFFLLLRGDVRYYTSHGFWWLLAVFCMVWANDSAAFFSGHFFGKTKLAPHISPAKTREGFVGGLIFSVIAAFVILRGADLVLQHPLNVAWYHLLIIGVLTAVAATIGDLAESFLKRATDVKDSGTIVPGHGGLLDRMDSLLFAVFVVFFYAAFLGSIPLM